MSILIHKDFKDSNEYDDIVNQAQNKLSIANSNIKYSSTISVGKIAPCVVIENKRHQGIIVPKVKVTLDLIKAIDSDLIQNEPKSQFENVTFDNHKESIDGEKSFEEKVIDPKGDVRDIQADRINLFKGFKYTKDPLGLYIKDSNDINEEKDKDEEQEDEDDNVSNGLYQLQLIPLEQRLIDMFDLNIK